MTYDEPRQRTTEHEDTIDKSRTGSRTKPFRPISITNYSTYLAHWGGYRAIQYCDNGGHMMGCVSETSPSLVFFPRGIDREKAVYFTRTLPLKIGWSWLILTSKSTLIVGLNRASEDMDHFKRMSTMVRQVWPLERVFRGTAHHKPSLSRIALSSHQLCRLRQPRRDLLYFQLNKG